MKINISFSLAEYENQQQILFVIEMTLQNFDFKVSFSSSRSAYLCWSSFSLSCCRWTSSFRHWKRSEHWVMISYVSTLKIKTILRYFVTFLGGHIPEEQETQKTLSLQNQYCSHSLTWLFDFNLVKSVPPQIKKVLFISSPQRHSHRPCSLSNKHGMSSTLNPAKAIHVVEWLTSFPVS